jgi:hypothetical protein
MSFVGGVHRLSYIIVSYSITFFNLIRSSWVDYLHSCCTVLFLVYCSKIGEDINYC